MTYVEKVHHAMRANGDYGPNEASFIDKRIDVLVHLGYVSGRRIYRGFQKLRGLVRRPREGLAEKTSED